MSGISAILTFDGAPVVQTDGETLLHSMAHRGPDGTALWNSGSVALGHCLLHTTPESLHEQQPLVWHDGALAISADARIDNRTELIAALRLHDRPASTIPDSQIILAAYQCWGEACPAHLLGDFAFVIWDARRQTLFCARDQFGVKPFYYSASARAFICASEIEALLQVAWMPRRLNELQVAYFLVGAEGDYASTFYQDVLRLPPAHSLSVSQSGLRFRRYWRLDTSRELRLGSDQDYAEAFRAVFTQAVSDRLRSAFPVGSHLSGGLDSSAVVCTARALLAPQGTTIHTFSGIFPDAAVFDPRIDERQYIEAVVAGGGVTPHYLAADTYRTFGDTPQRCGAPCANPHQSLDEAIYRTAREHDVRVLMTGHDGDTVISHGYEYLSWLARTGRWWSLCAMATQIARPPAWTRREILWEFGVLPHVPDPLRHVWRALRHIDVPLWDISGLICDDFARRTGLAHAMRAAHERTRKLRDERAVHGWEIISPGYVEIFEEMDRWMAVHAIEPRHPFYDRRLVEFCVALPHRQKFIGGWDRSIMRRGLAAILPPQVQWRKRKADLSANMLHGLAYCDAQQFDELISRKAALLQQYVNTVAMQQMYQHFRARPMQDADDVFKLFLAGGLSRWLQHTGFAA